MRDMERAIINNLIGDVIWKSNLGSDQKDELLKYDNELFSPYCEVVEFKGFDENNKPIKGETIQHKSERLQNEKLDDFTKYNIVIDLIYKSKLKKEQKEECLELWRNLFTPFVDVIDIFSLDNNQKKKLIEEKIKLRIVDREDF